MPTVEVTQLVKGSPEAAYRLACDMESYPQYMENVREVKVVERGPSYTVTAWTTVVDGREFKWVEKDVYDDKNLTITYNQIKGDLKKFAGQWTFRPVEGGTLVSLVVEFDLGIPVLSTMLHPVLARKTEENCRSMLQAIKARVEEA
ncbi:MAG: hypothetical protein PWQ31_1567 [Eubacteriales bacterium]|nr:hypothetical protein [Eubacteriales bacterium]